MSDSLWQIAIGMNFNFLEQPDDYDLFLREMAELRINTGVFVIPFSLTGNYNEKRHQFYIAGSEEQAQSFNRHILERGSHLTDLIKAVYIKRYQFRKN